MTFPNSLLVTEATVAPEAEAAWNEWYTDVHLPEILDCPGFLDARRYVTEAEDGSRSYLALYALSGPEALESPEFQERRGWGPFGADVSFRARLCRALG
jgi:hypothetical protein